MSAVDVFAFAVTSSRSYLPKRWWNFIRCEWMNMIGISQHEITAVAVIRSRSKIVVDKWKRICSGQRSRTDASAAMLSWTDRVCKIQLFVLSHSGVMLTAGITAVMQQRLFIKVHTFLSLLLGKLWLWDVLLYEFRQWPCRKHLEGMQKTIQPKSLSRGCLFN